MHDQDLIELKTLYRAAPVGLCLVDRDLRYVRINKWLAAINGKPPGEHIGRTIREIIPEVASQIEPIYRRVFESGEPILDVEIIGTLPAEPEVERSWRCSCYPMKSPDGMVERVSLVVEEITALKRVKQLLEGRLQFETLFSDLCATFTNLPDSALDLEIARGLERISETLNIDRVSLLEFSEDKTRLMIAQTYDYPDAPTLPGFVSGNLSPWIIEKIRRGEMLVLSRCPDDLPEEAIHEREYCLQRGLKSQLTLPLTVGGSILGAMAFSSYRRYVTWPEDLIQRLRIAGKVFANAMFRKRAEEALKNERQRLFTLLDELPALVSIKAPDYSIRYSNRFYREVFGNIQGKRCYELRGREGPCDGCRQIRVFETAEPQNFECTWIKPGQTFQIYLYPFAEIDGSPRVLSLGFDITKRKQAEEAVRQSEARYRSLVENIDLGISLIGTDYRIIMTNAAMGRIFQKPLSEFVGKECFREFEKREGVCSHCPGTRVMASGRPAEVETEGIRDDASRFPVRLSAFPVVAPNGQVDGFIEVVEDITQRRRAEEALRASEEELRQSKESYQILAGQLLNAQEAERGRLARELHDDLTQRLAALAIEAGRLEHQPQSSEGGISGRLKEMKDKLEEVCKDIHAISRRLHPSVLDDLGLADAVHSECASFAQRLGIVVNYQSENISPGVPPDIGLCIYRIIQESLGNIARHARATEVDISLVGKDGGIHLSLKDNGIGFNPLKVKKGGLGLSSMKERVYLVHGDFSIQSRPGQGTVIEVLIPLPRSPLHETNPDIAGR
jgi:PAS domain S-box-containing protein